MSFTMFSHIQNINTNYLKIFFSCGEMKSISTTKFSQLIGLYCKQSCSCFVKANPCRVLVKSWIAKMRWIMNLLEPISEVSVWLYSTVNTIPIDRKFGQSVQDTLLLLWQLLFFINMTGMFPISVMRWLLEGREERDRNNEVDYRLSECTIAMAKENFIALQIWTNDHWLGSRGSSLLGYSGG